MNIPSARALEQAAGQRLERAEYDPKKLSAIHAAISLGVTLLLSLVSLFLNRQIHNTGGLSGIGSRTALMSAQSVLQLAANLALPFWEVGFLYCALQLSRGRSSQPKDLTAGFRQWSRLLRLWLLQGILYFGIAFLAIQAASILCAMTPLGTQMLEAMEPFMNNTALLEKGLSDVQIEALLKAMIPVYAIAGAAFLAIALPFFYRFRMSSYLVFDQTYLRPMEAMRFSRRMMQGNCVALFKVDLHFWWYYGLLLLCAAASYLDVLLLAFGVTLPVSAEAAAIVCLGIHSIAGLLIARSFRSRVATVYACAYDSLIPKEV